MRNPLEALERIVARAVARNQSPVPLTSRRSGAGMLFSGGSGSDLSGGLDAYGSNSTLFSIVGGLATSTSQVSWCLYRRSQNPEVERVRVTSHAALDCWLKPNNFFTGQEFVETFQQHLDLVGEAWWVVYRVGRGKGLPLEMWPVRPDRMEPVRHPTKYITGYTYTSPDGEKVPLELGEVIFIRMPNPADIYRGMGPVQTLLTDLDSARHSAEWNRNFFRNSARPGGVIEVPTSLSDPDFNRLRDRWNESHRGVSAAHRVAFLEHGSFKPISFNMKEMQFTELRSLSSEIIREAFRFPKPLLGSVDDVNRAVAEAMTTIYAQWLIVPRLVRIRAALNNDLLPMFGGSDLEFDFESPVPADRAADDSERTSRAQAYSTLVAAGVEPEDAASVVGLPPMRMRALTTQPQEEVPA